MTTDADTRPPITAAATAFIESYARAMSFSSPTFPHSGNIPFIATALSAHYSNTTAYALGHPYIISVQNTIEHLEKLECSGLGYEVCMVVHRVEPVSLLNALCWVTWEIQLREGCGVEGWQWENVYGYQCTFQPSSVKLEGWWEVILCDNEILEIFAKVPNYMEI
ncbi:hypothetical protein K438DRAFT_1570825 [Mycena galopus ATCC 62051]|nr:hypothetical protein K438DRAFT_1570825 [Mycena galopus ATCC 62051]